MFNKDTILARLNCGETAEAIAAQFTDILNEAIAEVNKVDEQKADWDNLTIQVTEFFKKYYDIDLSSEDWDFVYSKLADIVEMFQMLEDLSNIVK